MKVQSLAVMAIIVCSSIVPATAQYDGAASVPDQYASGFQSITADDSKAMLTTLVSEEFSGRGTGQEGFLKAAEWFA